MSGLNLPGYIPFRRWSFRSVLLLLAILIAGTAFGLSLSASETVVVRINEDLAQYWRTTYDILVRPPGYRSEIEEKYGLVRPNSLLEIPGGISFAAYEAIKSIPGVEVAAPIAVLGEWDIVLGFINYGDTEITGTLSITEAEDILQNPPPDILEVDQCVVDEGVRIRSYARFESPRWEPPTIGGIGECFKYTGLLVAVDPEAEDALVGLSQAIVKGSYLQKTFPKQEELSAIYTRAGLQEGEAQQLASNVAAKIGTEKPFLFPILVNITTYISLTRTTEIWRIEIPSEGFSREEILHKGGVTYLLTLPHQRLFSSRYTVANKLISRLLPAWIFPKQESLVTFSPVRYREAPPLPSADTLVVEAVPIDSSGRRFRTKVERPVSLKSPYGFSEQGQFESERLQFSIEELTAVPLDIYFPPTAILRYDERNIPTEPRTLRPTMYGDGYLQPPPLTLTTMETAELVAGDDCISAIRVRVAGVDRFSPEAQSKIEAVAAEIINRTGLDVDIVVGSSPRPILVHLPGIGYVEEYWVQKGVALTTHREVQRANLLLFAAMLAVCALFIFNTTSTTVAGRIPEFGLLKALGWRESSLAGLVLTEGLLIGAVGGLAGTALALGLAKGLGLAFPLGRALLILPTAVLLCLAGFALPALRAARVSPVVALRQGEQTVGRVPRWLGYVGRSLSLRRMRTVLTAGVMAAGAGMLVLLVSLLVGMRGYLALTLLGQYILVRVSGVHWGMVGVVLGVGALATVDVLLVGVLERRREIGVLKALGWRTGAVARLFLLEGAVLGLLGGAVGTALGLAVYLALYRSVGAGLVGALAAGLGVPVAVGVLAAAYPAQVAARVPPAEAVRGE